LYTNFKLCKYSFDLVRYNNTFPDFEIQKKTGTIQPPDIAVGETGLISLDLPADWKSYDVIYISATDQYGRHINTWSWNISRPEDFISRIVASTQDKVTATELDSLLILSSGKTVVTFNMNSGLITGVRSNDKKISFNNGMQFAGFNASFREMKHYQLDRNYVVELQYQNACHARWTMLPGGWLKLDYVYRPEGSMDYAGITFSYPENLVTGATLMANGPYHVWKNRLKGTRFGIFEKQYNNTITGESWDYPEFKGYYSNFYAVKVETKELPITIVSGTSDLFLHLFTPEAAKYSVRGVRGTINPTFPSGNISFLHGISAIGTKFTNAEVEGPQSQQNSYSGETLTGTLYFSFGE
jgi:hypothetical protein